MYKLLFKENISSLDIIKIMMNEIGITDYSIIRNEYGYPYFSNVDNLYFNISNKDNYTICIMSNYKVGIDLERLVYKEKMLDRYFTEEEKEFILNSKSREDSFTKIWVMKESYVKRLGIGLSYGLKRVDTFKLKDYFHVNKFNNYYCCVCIDPIDYDKC